MFDQKELQLISQPQNIDELALSMSDDELLKLSQDWKGIGSHMKADLKKWSER